MMAAQKISKGSWTTPEVHRALYEWPNDTPLTEPISEKVENMLKRSLPGDLLPYALQLIKVDDFLSKKLALNLITFMVYSRDNMTVDPDKVISLRRIRVQDFLNTVRSAATVLPSTEFLDASRIAYLAIGEYKMWGLGKLHFNAATSYIAQQCEIPIFQVLDRLNILHLQKYDVSPALTSTAIWFNYIKKEYKYEQLELI